MASEESGLYAGLSGAELPIEKLDLGENVTLSKTFAHLMAPFIMAFAPAAPGKPHPAPWRAAKGGFGFDITVQLYIPASLDNGEWFDRLGSVWWFVALLRFRSAHSVIAPVISSAPFTRARESEEEIHFWPMEAEPRRLQLAVEPSILLEDDLAWIRDHWRTAGVLMRENKGFNLLFQSFDQSVFVRNPSLALLMLWSALEGLFSPARTELRFRVSANIAAYLEAPGKRRLNAQRRIAELYDARSAIAHGTSEVPEGALEDTYSVVRAVIQKIIEENHVPTREDLEARLFGNDCCKEG